jgi:hypothetical protein
MELLSIRIPKTGTHTLAEYLAITYGVQEFIELPLASADEPISPLYKNRERAKRITREYVENHPDRVWENRHLPIWAWEGLLPDTPRICFMRDPATWLFSNWRFAIAIAPKIFPPDMTVYEYMEVEYRQNWQSWYMDESIDGFSYIGFLETFDEDIVNIYRDIINKPLPKKVLPRNVSSYGNYRIYKWAMMKNKFYLKRVREVFDKDYELYYQAWHKFKGDRPMKIVSKE